MIHDTAAVGTPKVASAAHALGRLNPHVAVETHPQRSTPPRRGARAALRPRPRRQRQLRHPLPRQRRLRRRGPAADLRGDEPVGGAARASSTRRAAAPATVPVPRGPRPRAGAELRQAGIIGALPGVMGSMMALEAIKLDRACRHPARRRAADLRRAPRRDPAPPRRAPPGLPGLRRAGPREGRSSPLDSAAASGGTGRMIDIRPVGYLIGWLVTALGASMALPMAADSFTGDGNAQVFATTAILTGLVGVLMALACSRRDRTPLDPAAGLPADHRHLGGLPAVRGAAVLPRRPAGELHRRDVRGDVGDHHHRLDGLRRPRRPAGRGAALARHAAMVRRPRHRRRGDDLPADAQGRRHAAVPLRGLRHAGQDPAARRRDRAAPDLDLPDALGALLPRLRPRRDGRTSTRRCTR